MNVELLIQNQNKIYSPVVKEGIAWETERKNAPGKLTFSVVKDSLIDFQEGNSVKLTVDGYNMFYGFVFTKKRTKDDIIDVTAYDQLRYFKNKDTYVYKNKRASDFIQMVTSDFRLNVGDIEQTSYIIPSRVEDNTALFDMVGNALDQELMNKGNLFVLYDDFGKLTLKSLNKMRMNLVIDEETGENFDYSSSIDEETYNKVKLTYDNDETGKREVYITQDGHHINDWGVLQYFDTLQKNENGKAKADALLKLYNQKTKKLKISNAFGDCKVRAGSMPIVSLNLGDDRLLNYMLVEKCVHTFREGEHFMDLTLRGGDIIA